MDRRNQYHHQNHSFSYSSNSIHVTNTNNRAMDLNTDLRLGLSISPPSSLSSTHFSSPSSSPAPPRGDDGAAAIFVKVYLEGVPVGRKLDLSACNDYDCLIQALSNMFGTTILWPDVDSDQSDKKYVLTYEDKEGDWMMVGDVPWEMFLTNVKKLRITSADKC